MPGKVKVRIVSARDLPVMDRTSDLADAFVEVRLGNVMHKTDVCKKTLNPQWDSEWFRFEVDDEELQDEPLQIRIMDHDTVTAHDAIGKVNISLSSLLTQDPPGSIKGWFPIYDTMHGIRGELLIQVKVADFFVDSNKFRQTSCGVQFFYTCSIPSRLKATAIQGFVEELVVNDDPEYQWIDKIRTPRSSNEARQRIFTKLSGELQRKIGLKVLELGGNALIGYHQCFDIEGEFGIVVRGIGTAVTLTWITNSGFPTPNHTLSSSGEMEPVIANEIGFTFSQNLKRQHRISTESEPELITPPKDNLIVPGVLTENQNLMPYNVAKGVWNGPKQKAIEQIDLPFFTMTRFPREFLLHIGGVVSARSVKLLDKINHPDEPETRDAWWSEVRTEIRSHARAMGCNAVTGYYESTSICDELIVLSATGTASCVDLKSFGQPHATIETGLLMTKPASNPPAGDGEQYLIVQTELPESPDTEGPMTAEESTYSTSPVPGCSLCHIPYSDSDLPFPINLAKCHICRIHKVPDVIFSTTELPKETMVKGSGCLIQARVCRTKKKEKGEANAEIVSNILPFLEYELHQQLMNKLKVKGMNALFGLHLQICVGETLIIGIASCTAVYLLALPPPPLLKISGKRSNSDEDKRLTEIQKQIIETTNKNKVRFRISSSLTQEGLYTPPPSPSRPSPNEMYTHDDFSNLTLDFNSGGKDAFVVEVDDRKDEEVVTVLLDPPTPEGFYCCNTETLPGFSRVKSGVKMITAMERHALSDEDVRTNQQFAKMFDDTMKSLWFKLRHLNPCCLSNLRFDVEIPEDDNIQFAVSGIVVELDQPAHNELMDQESTKRKESTEELQFAIEEVEVSRKISPAPRSAHGKPTLENKIRMPTGQSTYCPAVEVTPMSYLPNAQVERYLGNVNLFFIRESLSIREDGGLNVFMQLFLAEAQAILRAHVQALGGNALVSYQLNEIVLLDNPHKHQGQCLLNVSGDAVEVSYTSEEFADSFSRVSLRKQRTTSLSDSNPHSSPIKLCRQRSATDGTMFESTCGIDTRNDI